MHKLAQLDHQYVWHPFTQMRDWLKREPILITEGRGAVLRDVQGNEYLDANASIWTNLHGHAHPKINAAIRQQLKRISHSSALGLANEPASILAARLVGLAADRSGASHVPASGGKATTTPIVRPNASRSLSKVFFSDDGSTAVEVALKLSYEFARRSGRSPRPKFLSLAGAYHGDTVGAVSLGHIDLFHKAYAGLLFKTASVPSPYCYRCGFNRAKPERADARTYRRCNWECVDAVEKSFAIHRKKGNPLAALVLEPRMQGAAGMIPQPEGWLKRAAQIAHGDGAQVIADEVMTGFGRTGSLFACQGEGVTPDFLALAKGLTGGALPMAATLTTQATFDAFLGEYSELRTFFHGHSYTGNQLGAAAALASLEILQSPASVLARKQLAAAMEKALQQVWALPNVGDIRQVGLIAGIELVRDWRSREPIPWTERAGVRTCEAMARRGVLTRPVGNVIVLIPPYCTTGAQLRTMVGALCESIADVFK